MIQTCAYLYSSNFTPQVKEAKEKKPRSANSYFYQKATFSLVVIVSWR